MLRFMITILELVGLLIYMFLVLEVLTDKGVLDIKEVCYGIDYLLDDNYFLLFLFLNVKLKEISSELTITF